ncbi:uncharacterized protein [Chelonus insularis]|uniref:uncharacterized protein isoform X2 n=1 Tax=Chelonus insularis TaxID=460826 RepID=UPI00158964CA|nr:uncharacterized protein LOC118071542 isoform X2 [Chelonus insularis]
MDSTTVQIINTFGAMDVIMMRDQRTTSHRVLDRDTSTSAVNSAPRLMTRMTKTTKLVHLCSRLKRHVDIEQNNNSNNNNNVKHSSVRSCNPCHVRHNFYSEFKRLTRKSSRTNITTWLIFCLFSGLGSLLVLLLVVSVQSAPTSMALDDRRLSQPPKWVNPCGLAAEDIDGSLDVEQLKDEQLLAQVVVQAKTALDHAQLFCDDFVKKTFHTTLNDVHSTWKDNHYDWLPGSKDIPKQLGEQLTKEYLNKLELDTALLNAYEFMQKYAVGLEQIVWDQEDHRLEFLKQFKDTEYKLRTVLCELQVALMERGVTPRADVTREVMTPEYRAMASSSTYRNLRDWLIFRDYMNGLEYVVQVFEHLKRNLES